MITSQSAIEERLRMVDKNHLSRKAAQAVLGLKLAPADLDRMNALAARAREGTLTKEEDEELENYLKVGQHLSLLKSRARQILKKRGNGA